METFTLAPVGGWIVRAFGRNPLVRTSDRIEALLLIPAVTIALAAAPIAGAIGTAVYEARSHANVERATSRHTVTAIAVEDSVTTVRPYTIIVDARWRVDGTEHTGSFEWDDMVKAGDRLTIWVDSDGNYVGPPTPTSRAGADAVVAGLATWLGAVAATSALIAWLRSLLNRLRYGVAPSMRGCAISGFLADRSLGDLCGSSHSSSQRARVRGPTPDPFHGGCRPVRRV